MDKATQKARILAYCKEHGSITVRDAAVKLDINSPTKRISELRRMPGIEVRDIEECRTKASGELVKYKRYFIREVAADG